MISSNTERITIMPITIFLIATGAPANCNPFCSTPQIDAPITVPNKSPCPPSVDTPPITDAATAYNSYAFPLSIVPMPLVAHVIRPTTHETNDDTRYAFSVVETMLTPESRAASTFDPIA